MAKTTAIRAPTDDPQNHTVVLRQLKEASETGQRLRGDPNDSYVRVGELVGAGVARFVNGGIVAPSPASLPPTTVPSTRKVNTAGSLTGGGALASDLTLELVNDSASPGNSMLYGTNASGAKGWYAQPSGGGGGGTNFNTDPDTHPSSPTAWDDEFEYGSTIDTTGARRAGANAWTWFNQTSGGVSGAATISQGALSLSAPTEGAVVNDWRLVMQPVPASGAWAFTAKLLGLTDANYQAQGMVLLNNATGKFLVFGITFNSTSNMMLQEYTNYTTINSSPYLAPGPTVSPNMLPNYYEIDYDGSSVFTFSAWASGYSGMKKVVITQTLATWLGSITHIGLGVNSANATLGALMVVDWFRRTA